MDMSVQALINSGYAWRLEGYVGRQCMNAIGSGYAILGTDGHRDYYGNYVPSRYEVAAGSKGTVQFANRRRKSRGQRPLRGIDFDNNRAYDDYEDEYDA